ncbi:zinc-dependent alcohol dehydrogenase [Demequina maris]|uniref:zinc-dependent alcohol dehydrogenase n=1 Tax=Demequina maris TaxID=1638982 RepID=UPI0009E5AD56|nr:alcohol dehydrogenase catalytic domain-containing protein [Demequina maris]
MTQMMQAAVWTGTDTIDVRDIVRPEPAAGEVLVRVEHVGICGTDLAIMHGAHPRAQTGLVPGHEIVGVVAAATADGPPVGARVVSEPLITCGECRACRTGSSHVCKNLGLFGIDAAGGLADYVALPAASLHVVPGHVPALQAVLVEPLAVAVHAVDMAGLSEGDTVAVFGGGPIGILVAMVARQAGARAVVIAEPNDWRRKVAADLGFVAVDGAEALRAELFDLTDGEGADVTFDAAGHPSITTSLTEVTRVLGRIVIVAVHKKPAEVDLRAVCFKEQSLVGVRVYTHADVQRAVELLAGDLDLSTLPVASYPLSAVEDAFHAAADGGGALKVLVSPGGAA